LSTPHTAAPFATQARYENQYISVITIQDRAITHWRDYLNR